MRLEYALDSNDYLQFQLYNSSINPRYKKTRRKNWIILFTSAFLLAIVLFNNSDKFLSYYFIGIGVLIIFGYPDYAKSQRKKHFEKYVGETYKSDFSETSIVILNDEFIETYDKTGTSKINITELEKIYETSEYFFLKLKFGSTLIIPKSKIDVIVARERLVEIANQVKAQFIQDLNWRW